MDIYAEAIEQLLILLESRYFDQAATASNA